MKRTLATYITHPLLPLSAKATTIVVAASRIFVGIFFLASGFAKAVDPIGTGIKLAEYFTLFGLPGGEAFVTFCSFALSSLEFLVGTAILIGIYRNLSSVVLFAFMCVMTPLTLYLALENPIRDCGCFGDAIVLTNWQTFFKNLVLLLLSYLLLRYNKRVKSGFAVSLHWLILIFSLLFSLTFSFIGYIHEPVLDFRPYTPGVNILKDKEIPQGAPRDKIETTLIYQKAGKQQSFTLENYPANDTTWSFVDAVNHVVERGYHPPIEEFDIYDQTGNNITQEILSRSGYTFLLVSPSLSTANDSNIDRINEIYDYAVTHNYAFYALTGSTPQEIINWSENSGAEYPFLYVDATTLKTMMRSNPGMMLLHDGTILWQKGNRTLPADTELTLPLDQSSLGKLDSYDTTKRVIGIIALYLLPLLLLFYTEKTVLLFIRHLHES